MYIIPFFFCIVWSCLKMFRSHAHFGWKKSCSHALALWKKYMSHFCLHRSHALRNFDQSLSGIYQNRDGSKEYSSVAFLANITIISQWVSKKNDQRTFLMLKTRNTVTDQVWYLDPPPPPKKKKKKKKERKKKWCTGKSPDLNNYVIWSPVTISSGNKWRLSLILVKISTTESRRSL